MRKRNKMKNIYEERKKEGEKDRKRGKYIEGALAGFICISAVQG